MVSETRPSATFFSNALAFRRWLTAHAGTAKDLLVGYHKVGTGKPGMSWPESVDEALCVGWIDGVRKRIDDDSYSIRFTPRKPSSIWSAVNIAKFEQLEAAGRMKPAGRAAFGRRTEAKSRVYSHEQSEAPTLSADEVKVFKGDRAAWLFFEATPPGYQKRLLHWVCSAKRADTRLSRFTRLLQASAAGQRLA
ncbi:MAG: bacteriocin-protection protein [Comamonadaceae bacterium]|nr:MAG: bacteriocin-protection protein [Comamonadaceae bacterium]